MRPIATAASGSRSVPAPRRGSRRAGPAGRPGVPPGSAYVPLEVQRTDAGRHERRSQRQEEVWRFPLPPTPDDRRSRTIPSRGTRWRSPKMAASYGGTAKFSSSPSGGRFSKTGTREVHNKLEQNRRAHLKECFETLKKNVPNVDDKKTSNLSVLRSALRYIQTLKRKEKEYEHEMERLAREKIAIQQRLSELKKELSQRMDAVEIERVIRQTVQPEDDQASTSTASEGEDNLERDEDAATPAVPRAPPPAARPSPSSFAPRAPVPPPTVIARAAVAPRPSAVSHPSVIRAVSRALPANHKHLPHIAPSPGPALSARPVGHVAARLGAPLPSRLPALYPQGVSVSQPAVVGHVAHAFAPTPAGAAAGQQGATAAPGKPAAVLAPHPQLVGQAAVTMVTVPTFPVSTIRLA
ncbi:max-binding protein MNT-like isoform X5 [Phycodurus eques]|uniref:max-binding protein MNT-like isoform X5 n=1 Tax=Phycodurus eques TaxID=693459 RepID=UPI002ACDA5BC|nr:max-binding protein MNT-like isoform X5 [Phycodurus eques]